MIRTLRIAAIVLAAAASTAAASAQEHRSIRLDANGNLDALIAKHAAAYGVPENLVRRVIARESGGNPRVISQGNYGLMQIKLGTARAMGYQGSVAGLLDADTNMEYAVKYLAGAYHAAGGNPDRAVHYYAAGYYYAAKRQGVSDTMPNGAEAFAAAPASAGAAPTTTMKTVKHLPGEDVASSSNPYSGKPDYF